MRGIRNMSENYRKAAIFLDRDGTIIDDRGFVSDVKDIVFLNGAIAALKELQKTFELFIVTNQSGVGLGAISRSDAQRCNEFVLNHLSENGITIKKVYSCMHCRADKCECIKPNPFFLYKARDEFGIDLKFSYVVGDHPHDVEFAWRGGATGLYVLTGHGQKHFADILPGTRFFDDLPKASQWILQNYAERIAPSASVSS